MSKITNISPSGRFYGAPSSFGSLRLVGITADGFKVYDRPTSHCHTDRVVLVDALLRIHHGTPAFAKHLVEFDHPIAKSTCVPTRAGDQIVFAKRPKRNGWTRFVLGRTPEPTCIVTIILKRREENPNELILIASYPGTAEPEPWDRHATEGSVAFWATHALCWGSEEVHLDTLAVVDPNMPPAQ